MSLETSYDASHVGSLTNQQFDDLAMLWIYHWVRSDHPAARTPQVRRTALGRLIKAGLLEGYYREVWDLYNATIAEHGRKVLPEGWTTRFTRRRIFGFTLPRSEVVFFGGSSPDGRLMTFEYADDVHNYTRRILNKLR